MDARISSIFEELDQRLADYEKWREPLRKFQTENIRRVNQDGYTWDMFLQEDRELEARLMSQHDPYSELHRLTEELCLVYLKGDATDRAAIRSHVSERQPLGWFALGIANRVAATRIQSGQDESQLRLGLTAIAIANGNSDWRDVLLSLADLYVQAEEVGLDPKPVFAEMAELSTAERTIGGCESLAKTMREFENYAVLASRRGRQRSK